MANKMLIDASHPEETRVVVLRGNRVEEFDFESASKKQLRGNIYLAKVTRVEPSLQAAFVDYGGNRHGFLAFSEIHPDYYQIPVVDRQALIEEEARAQRDADDDEGGQRRSRRHRRERNGKRAEKRATGETLSEPFVGAPESDVVESQGEEPAEGSFYDNGVDTRTDAPADRDDGQERFAGSHHLARGPDDLQRIGDDDERRPFDGPDFGVEESPGESIAAEDDEPPAGPEAGYERYESAAQAPDVADDLAAASVDAVTAEHEESRAIAVYGEAEPDFVAAADAAAAEYLREHPVEDEAAERHDETTSDQDGENVARRADESDEEAEDEEDHVEQLGGDAMDEAPVRPQRYRRQYKIQEVIKRRQVLLVQVVKEERGNKGAALTTYLSLAGRYSVLMPNTARGGGISRKITDSTDRQRLKSIAQDLEVPEGMGVILRTAGASRTKPEVKRDFEYLLRMWETVRETTLRSSAPTLVYEEGSLIKRAIRDLYNKDIDDILVAGEKGYREARDFMRLLMPTHVDCVQPYREAQPIFAKSDVETQLDALYLNNVTLKSGGYIVINQTEALVAIDVNSGRSTREHNIEDTAARTNLEAADEVARQLRLRDLAGLIVVDFIDMEEGRNNRAVERRLKDALKNDRARIQVGRISHFGLLEMSRQRIRTGVLEGSTEICPHCSGSGILRSTASIALHVLRVVEDALIKNASLDLIVKTRSPVALYILNEKRAHLRELECRFGVAVTVDSDDSLIGSVYHAIERGGPASGGHEQIELPAPEPVHALTYDYVDEAEGDDVEAEPDGGNDAEDELGASDGAERRDGESETDADGRRKRRRRRRRGRGDREASGISANAPQPPDDGLGVIAAFAGAPQPALHERPQPEMAPEADEGGASETHSAETKVEPADLEAGALSAEPIEAGAFVAEAAPAKPPRRSRRSKPARDAEPDDVASGEASDAAAAEAMVEGEEEDLAPPARRSRRPSRARSLRRPPETSSVEADSQQPPDAAGPVEDAVAAPAENFLATPEETDAVAAAGDEVEAERAAEDAVDANAAETAPASAPDPDRPKRSGWWQRAKATLSR